MVTYKITATVRQTFPEGVDVTREEWDVLATWP